MTDGPTDLIRPPARPQAAAPPEWSWLDPAVEQLAALGLTVRLFDADGRVVHGGMPAGPFSRLMWQATEQCCGTVGHGRRLADDQLDESSLSCLPGCFCLVMPLQRRRRRLAVAVVSVVCRDMPDGEELARFCQSRQIDRVALLRAARQQARFDSSQVEAVRLMARQVVNQAVEQHAAQTELDELSQNLTHTYEELSLVYRIAAGMAVTEKPDEHLRGIGAELIEVIDAESLVMRYFRPDQPLVCEHISIGDDLTSPTGEQIIWDELLSRFEARPEAIVNNQPGEDGPNRLRSLSAGGRVRQLAAVPMVRNGRLIGAIAAMNKRRGDFDSVEVKLIKSIADAAAVFLENAFLYEDLQQLLMGMLRALTSSIDAKDPYTCGHSERVAMLARKIALAAGLDPNAASRAYLAGLLHDIGKIGVPEAVLTKPGRLSKAEFALIRKHPEIGARILAGIKEVQDLVAGVLCHHERFDGRGYPQGLAGDRIPLFGRIVGLADCFDAMTSNRTYRRAMPLEAVFTEIRRFAGTQFDPRIVEALFSLDPTELLQQQQAGQPVDPLGNVIRQAPTGLMADPPPVLAFAAAPAVAAASPELGAAHEHYS